MSIVMEMSYYAKSFFIEHGVAVGAWGGGGVSVKNTTEQEHVWDVWKPLANISECLQSHAHHQLWIYTYSICINFMK